MLTTQPSSTAEVLVQPQASGRASGSIFDPVGPGAGNLLASVLGIYVLVLISRILDIIPIWWMRIPLLLLAFLTVATLAKGDLGNLFSSSITRCFAVFTFWCLICYPFSVWRAASKDSAQQALLAFLEYLIIVQLTKTADDWRKVAGGYAYAVLVAGLTSFYRAGVVENGRIAIAGGSLSDPNEFALILLVGLPFWWFKAGRATGFRRVVFWLCTIPVYMAFARTGSRSGLIAMAALLLVTVLFAKLGQRVMIVCFVGVGIIAASAFLPGYLFTRFTTIFTAGNTANLDAAGRERLQSDIASSNARQEYLMDSIRLTFEHPIFGVGPGAFGFAAWDERKATTGAGGLAQVSHNTYTQISSETGIPGFLFFIATMFLCLKTALTTFRSAMSVDKNLSQAGKEMFAALTALAVGIFFLSVGYTYMISVMFALAASLSTVAQKALSEGASSRVPVAATVTSSYGSLGRTPVKRIKPSKIPIRKTPVSDRIRPTYLGSRGRNRV